MFYHLKIMLRNLQRGGIYSAINIGGLAIGMAAAILILAWIYHEWSFDRFHAKEKQLYVAYNRAEFDGSLRCWDWTPKILGPTLKEDYPEISGMARMNNSELLFVNKENGFKIRTLFTDPDFLTMFDFPLMQGNAESALNDPYSLILTEKAAIRLFGRTDLIGQTLLANNQYPVTVTGVMKNLPGNTLFHFEAIVSQSLIKAMGWYYEDWSTNNNATFIELHPNARLDLVNENIRGIAKMHSKDAKLPEVFLYPLSKRHIYGTFENGVPAGGLIDTLRLFGVIAGLILFIACINFMNLSTARSQKRAKEVGVRKMMGGKRLSLIKLFLGESMLVAFIAGSLASWFAGLTIFISCLGLFALVAYMAETRRKEIGIRKVLGASVGNLVVLLSKEFLILVFISVAIASPVAWWAMEKWLANYAYRTDIPWWIFVLVGVMSLGIALLTVGFQAVKAAMANPVKSIKSE